MNQLEKKISKKLDSYSYICQFIEQKNPSFEKIIPNG